MLVQDVSVNGTLENKEIQNYIDYLEKNGTQSYESKYYGRRRICRSRL